MFCIHKHKDGRSLQFAVIQFAISTDGGVLYTIHMKGVGKSILSTPIDMEWEI